MRRCHHQRKHTQGEVIDTYGDDITPEKTTDNAATGVDTLTTYTGMTVPGGSGTPATWTGTAATTTWQSDPLTGLLQYKQYADGTQDTYGYNGKNQLVSEMMRGLAAPTTFAYNVGGLVDSISYDGGSSTSGGISYRVGQFDADVRVLADTQVEGTQTLANSYAYNADGQLTRQTQAQLSSEYTVDYDYFASTSGTPGNLQKMSLKNGTTLLAGSTYGYATSGDDSSARLQTVTDAISSKAFTYTYQGGSNQVATVSSTGVTTTNGYDASGRLSSTVTTKAAGQTIYSETLTYNALSQIATRAITQATAVNGSAVTYTSQTLQYDYDPLAQLKTVTDITDPAHPVVVESFTFDAMGNRTDGGFSQVDTTTHPKVQEMNQYTAYTSDSGATLSLSYEAAGRTTSDGRFNYGYDALNRMTSAEAMDHSAKVTYAYDASGNLIGRTVLTGWSGTSYGSSVTTNFAYDGDHLIAELDGGGNVLRTYQWGLGAAGKVGALLSVTDNTNPSSPVTYTTVFDASGNLINLLDSAGGVAASYVYSAFGKLLSATGAAKDVCPIGWQTMYRDAVTGVWRDAEFIGRRGLTASHGPGYPSSVVTLWAKRWSRQWMLGAISCEG